MDNFKVLFHVSDQEVWPKALANITNFLKDVGQGGAEIVVVANAAGVLAYNQTEANKDLIDKIAGLANTGVKFKACRNALIANSLNEGQLPSFLEVVPAGITEIVKKQGAGFAYIKP